MTIQSDELLIDSYKETKDPNLIGELFRRYSHLVYGVCLKYLKNRENAQDAVMNIYERLLEKLISEEINHFKSWLYTVSRNHCLMELRKSNPEMESEFMEINLPVHLYEEEIPIEADLEALESCLETLKEAQARCVKLFYLKKLSYQQVTEQTEFDLKSVKSFIQNGKRNLKICLENNNVKR